VGVSAETGAVGDLYCPLCEHTFEEGERCPRDNTRLVRIAQQSEQLIGRDLDGRYTIVEKLGQGGMGTVFRGTQHSVGREVAIKVVTPSLVTEAVTIKRFLREATIASRLSHPNAVGVLDFGQTKDGLFYLVMELVTGRTLDTVVEKDGRLTPARIVRIGAQICDALEGAHQLEIIHRDLKPQNVIVLSTGRDLIKVLDFGLAKSLSKDIASSTMTNAGALLGSPAFMPPEVVTGQTSDARADLYSFGCLLHYCAAGELPFQAATIHELIAMHASEPAKRLTNVPLRLAIVIQRLLAKSPDDRYPSATATREALEESLGKTLSPSPMMAASRAATPSPVPDDAPENDTSSSTVLGWDGASSGKPGVPNRPSSTPASGPVRHSASRTPTDEGPPLRSPVRPITPAMGAKVVPADPRMITAKPIDPRVGTNPAAPAYVPRVDTVPSTVPQSAAFDARVGTNPAAPPYTSPPAAAFDARVGTNPAAPLYANPQVPGFDPRVGTNPAAAPYTNPHAAAFDPHIGTNPAALPYNPHAPSAPIDPRTVTPPAQFAASSRPAMNPAGPHPGQPLLPPIATKQTSTALMVVIAILVVATGGTIAFFAMGGG